MLEMAGKSVTTLLRGSRRRMTLVSLWRRRRPSAAQMWQWVESAGRSTPREAAVAMLRRLRQGPASRTMDGVRI